MAALLKDAVKPNLVQTLEGTPAIMHGGPFANIAHGCNSVRATRLALKLADYCITEAGFGSDLGAEKFMDIKCRMAGLAPSCVVVVATVRALKYNGGVPKAELSAENVPALEKGIVNLKAHVENMQKFGVPVVVAINRFGTDSEGELQVIDRCCQELGVPYALSEVFAKGGEGGVELAKTICQVIDENEGKTHFAPIYPIEASVEEKIAHHRPKDLWRKGCDLYKRGSEVFERHQSAGWRYHAGLHCQDSVFPVGQCQALGPSHGLHDYHSRSAAVQRRGVCSCLRR